MKKSLIISFVFCAASFSIFAQGKEERTLFVVDSIPITKEPDEESGTIANEDVALLQVITTKSEILKYGYNNIDKLIFITTKEYQNRPEEIKKIPNPNLMERKNGVWHLKNDSNPYTGPFIDYFPNGKKHGEGQMKNGRINGIAKTYYLNGKVSAEEHYLDGDKEGICSYFFKNGLPESKTNYKKGEMDGLDENWYPNGQKKQVATYKNGELDGESTLWYSTGELNSKVLFINGKPQFSKDEEKFEKMHTKAQQFYKENNLKAAIKELTKCLEIKPNDANTYFLRGTMKLNDFEFDTAIEDLDKAIKTEPMMVKAYTNRAFARLRKYQFKNSRTLSKTNEITVMASKDVVPIPEVEKKQICEDLNKAKELGDKNELLIEALQQNCQ